MVGESMKVPKKLRRDAVILKATEVDGTQMYYEDIRPTLRETN